MRPEFKTGMFVLYKGAIWRVMGDEDTVHKGLVEIDSPEMDRWEVSFAPTRWVPVEDLTLINNSPYLRTLQCIDQAVG